MALTPDPPPLYPSPPGATATWPAAPLDQGGSDTITTTSGGPNFDILGRDGNPATPEQVDIIETLLFNWPYQDPHGSWCGVLGGAYVGRGGGRFTHDATILFEFRTAAEVAAVAAGTHGEVPFAATVYNAPLAGGGPLPPADGYAAFQGGPYVPADWVGYPFHRVLIREDLLAGGAGAQWAGAAFLGETILHEMGHVAQGMLMDLYGPDYVIDNTCAMFGVPSSHWGDVALNWADRAVEASAEFYKDMCMDWRRYDNRTNLQLPRGKFLDFLKLYVDYFENPYWDYHNIASAFYSYDFVRSGYVLGGVQPVALWLPDYHNVPHGVAMGGALAWPHVGDTPQLRYNFHPDDEDWLSDFHDDFGDPVDAVTAATTMGKVKLGFDYQPLSDWGTGGFSAAIRVDEVEINPADVPSGKGVINADLTGLPAEGHVMSMAFPGGPPWHYPRPDAPPHIDDAILPPAAYSVLPAPAPKRKPWWEWNGIKRTRQMIRDITWPYHGGPVDLDSQLQLGDGVRGVVRL